MKNRLEDFLIILISHAIGASWACLILAYRLLEKMKPHFALADKPREAFSKLVSAKLYK